MPDYPSACTIDTNILIDLHVGGVLDVLFQLPLQLVAPDVVIAELEKPDGTTLVERGLKSHELSGAQLLDVVKLRGQHPQLSANDVMLFVLARDLNVTLLTGDRHLRKVAERAHVPVHGTLWLLDEMVHHDVIAAPEAAQALKRIIRRGGRLPQDEYQRRIKAWKSK